MKRALAIGLLLAIGAAAQTERIPSQSQFFTIPVATSIGAAVVMLALVPMLRRLTASVKA